MKPLSALPSHFITMCHFSLLWPLISFSPLSIFYTLLQGLPQESLRSLSSILSLMSPERLFYSYSQCPCFSTGPYIAIIRCPHLSP